LKEARLTGDDEQIRAKWEQLQTIKSEWKLKKQQGCKKAEFSQHGCSGFKAKKALRRQCFLDFIEAQKSGDQQRIETTGAALLAAREEVKQAKKAFRTRAQAGHC